MVVFSGSRRQLRSRDVGGRVRAACGLKYPRPQASRNTLFTPGKLHCSIPATVGSTVAFGETAVSARELPSRRSAAAV